MRILLIDPSLDILEQFRRISSDTGIPIACLTDAWNEKNVTQPIKPRDFLFDLVPEKLEYKEPKPLSYKAQQKLLPKFLKKR